jgi:hypothetical protein
MGLGSGIRDPRSGKNLFRIPDPGVKKAPDPGSGSATLEATEKFKNLPQRFFRPRSLSMHVIQVGWPRNGYLVILRNTKLDEIFAEFRGISWSRSTMERKATSHVEGRRECGK